MEDFGFGGDEFMIGDCMGDWDNDLDAHADLWEEEQEFNDLMEDLFYEDEEEINRKLAEFGLDDVDFDDDDDDFDDVCPMCGEEIDPDTGWCPVCRECV